MARLVLTVKPRQLDIFSLLCYPLLMKSSTRQNAVALITAEPGLSLADMARRLGVSKQRVHQIMKGLGKTGTQSGSALGHRDEYKCWHNMIARCTDSGHQLFRYYGGRGIKVCSRWMNSFPAFLTDMGPRPSAGASIDRVNNNGNYEPGNCRWATAREQQNNRRNNRKHPKKSTGIIGQPTKITPEVVDKVEAWLAKGERIPKIADRLGLAESTIRKCWSGERLANARAGIKSKPD